MPEYVVRADTTPRSDFSGTAFAELDVRWLVNAERNGAQLTGIGQTVYPASGASHETHLHPDAEETVIVLSGCGVHRVHDKEYEIRAGDIVFVPRGAVHSAHATGSDDMVVLWVLGGASSLEAAGYETSS